MTIELNGKKMNVHDGVTLASVLHENNILPETNGVAVAVNAAVVPRQQWAELHLRDGDTVEVIHAVQGG